MVKYSKKYQEYLRRSIAASELEIQLANRTLVHRQQVAAGSQFKRVKGCQYLHPEQGSVRNPCNLKPCIVMITFMGKRFQFCSPSHALIWLSGKVEEVRE